MKKAPNKAISVKALKNRVLKEIGDFESMGLQEWDLKLKWQEISEWLPKQDPKHIEWVKRLIWKPTGISDFRRIEPELIFVKSFYELQTKNIWGEDRTRELPSGEDLEQHWSILRHLVSTARDTGGGGMRMMKFLVRDKVSRKYLGVICISSDFMNASSRDEKIGWSHKEFSRPSGKLFGKLNNLAQGQAIVPTQPFGSSYNGTKLLALLCLSKEVADKWKEIYGDTLVGVTTTALWGSKKNISSYDGLEPYWMRIADTSGKTPINFTDETYSLIKSWLSSNYPEKYNEYFPKTSQHIRDVKKKTILFVLGKLGIPPERRMSDAKRLAYMSLLYRNSGRFLRGEITDAELEPAFDNSVEELVRFWKFGIKGDTTRKLSKSDKKDIRAKFDPLPQDITLNLGSSAKARIDNLFAQAKDAGKEKAIDDDVNKSDWYQDLATLSWDEAKKKYLSQVAR